MVALAWCLKKAIAVVGVASIGPVLDGDFVHAPARARKHLQQNAWNEHTLRGRRGRAASGELCVSWLIVERGATRAFPTGPISA